MTAAQRQHARQQRALLALRRAAVRYTNSIDGSANVSAVFAGNHDGDREARELAHNEILASATELVAASQRYAHTLTASERRRMGRRRSCGSAAGAR